MYFSYAEKKGSIFRGWSMREVALDCSRRYLYYTEPVPDHLVVPCSGPPIIHSKEGLIAPSSTNPSLGNTPGSPGVGLSAGRGNPSFAQATPPPPPHDPYAVVWKTKIKFDRLTCSAHTHQYKVYDPHLKEIDFYQIEIYGEKRVLSTGEIPPPEPLLCPSTGLAGMPGRCVIENEEFIRDPFFQIELYEGLRTLFNNIRLDQQAAALRDGRPFPEPEGSAAARFRTITSPHRRESGTRKTTEPPVHDSTFAALATIGREHTHARSDSSIHGTSRHSVGSTSHSLHTSAERVSVRLRFRTEYEFRRFFYVIRTVLGYDKLMMRPYRGFPPYDPRNSIVLAHLPLYRWHSFKNLQKAPIYSFVRGDLYGRANNKTVVLLKGGFLCLTLDTAIVLRDEGTAHCQARLQHVEYFRYNYVSAQPYFAFISDRGHTDLFFVPQPPLFGDDSISRFNAREEVVRVHRIVYEACFCSNDIRRVIDIREVGQSTVRQFIDDYVEEFQYIRVDLMNPNEGFAVADENLPAVWEAAQARSHHLRLRSLRSEPAIPLYENHTNQILTRKQLQAVRRHVQQSGEPSNEIIGFSIEEAGELALGEEGSDPSSTFGVSRIGEPQSTTIRGRSPDNTSAAPSGQSNDHRSATPSYVLETAEYLPNRTNSSKCSSRRSSRMTS